MGRGHRHAGAVALALAVASGGWACGDGEESANSTLVPLDGTPGATRLSVPPGSVGPRAGTVANGDLATNGAAGSGFVSVDLWLAADGVEETISLDRGSVAADELDPVSLDAKCTVLDGGNGLTVSVIDMRRLSSGARLIAATLRVEGRARRGTHNGTLVVGDANQETTTYAGKVTVRKGGRAGSFETVDETGNTATGRFTCAEAAP